MRAGCGWMIPNWQPAPIVEFRFTEAQRLEVVHLTGMNMTCLSMNRADLGSSGAARQGPRRRRFLSGVVSKRATDVAEAMGEAGFDFVETRAQDFWCALVFSQMKRYR